MLGFFNFNSTIGEKKKRKKPREGESNLFLIITLFSWVQMLYKFFNPLFAIYTLHMTCQKWTFHNFYF